MRTLLGATFALVVLSGCERGISGTGEHTAGATRIMFVEQEEGIEPYPTRAIVTREFVRIDDGEGSTDFVLFDRKHKLIHSVVSATRTIMTIESRPVDIEPPMALELTQSELGPMKNAPTIGGRTPVHYRLGANGETCYDVVAIEGLMEDAVAAFREFRLVLAGDSAVTFNAIPADLHNACNMAMNTFAPNRHLAFGFPIQEWDKDGYSRYLLEFDESYTADPALFELPQGYRSYFIEELRKGELNL